MKLYGKVWPRDFKKRYFIGMHMTDADQHSGIPDMLARADPAGMMRELADAGCDAVYFYMSCHIGNCYYPSKVKHARVHSAMRGRDFLGAATAAAAELKMAFIAVYEFMHLEFKMHPEKVPADWVHRFSKDGAEFPGGMCWNGGYGDFVLEQILEVARNYPVAGFYIDMLDYPGLEMCPACIRAFRSDTGNAEYPTLQTPRNSPLFKEYKMWTFFSAAQYLHRVRREVQRFIPDATVVNNYHVGICEDCYQERKAVDYVGTDPGCCVLGTKLAPWFRALSEDRPDAPFDMLSDDVVAGLLQIMPAEPYLAWCANTLAHGGVPCTDGLWERDGSLNPASLGVSRVVYDHIDKVSPWISAGERYLKCAGLYYSQETEFMYYNPGDKRFYRHSDYQAGFLGAGIMLEEEHIPYDVLTRLQLCRLDEYAVIFLPNAVCLSQKEVAALRAYVRGGGTLLASYRASLADEWGNLQDNFQLADVFGVDYLGAKLSCYQAVQLNVAREQFPFEPWENHSITVNGDALGVQKRDGARMIATLHDRYRPSKKPGELFAMKNAFVVPNPFGAGIVENRFGQGRCLYFAAKIFMAYAHVKNPELRKIAARWLIGAETARSPVRLETMPCVKVSAFERPDQAEWVIHLVNQQALPGEAERSPSKTPLTEKILPVHDVKVCLNTGGLKPVAVSLPLSGAQCAITATGPDCYEIVLPRVHLHEVLAVNFDRPWPVRKEKSVSGDAVGMVKYSGQAGAAREKIVADTDGWNGLGEGQG